MNDPPTSSMKMISRAIIMKHQPPIVNMDAYVLQLTLSLFMVSPKVVIAVHMHVKFPYYENTYDTK